MLKVMIGAGVSLVALAAAAFGGYQYLQNMARSEIEASFTALRSTGATAAHGAIDIDLIHRTAEIKDIVIKSTGTTGEDIAIEKVVASGIDIWSKRFAAQRLVYTNLVANGRSGDNGEVQSTVKAPQVIAEDIAESTSSPNASPLPSDPFLAEIALFARINAASVSIPTLTTSLTMPMQAAAGPLPPGMNNGPLKIDYTYNGVRLEGLHDGIITRATVAKVDLTGRGAIPDMSATLDALAVERIDVPALVGLGLETRQAQNGYYPVYGAYRSGPIVVNIPSGGEFKIAGMSGNGFGLNPAKASYAKLQAFNAMTAKFGRQPPKPEELRAFLASIGELYEGIQMGPMEITGVHLASLPGAPPFSLDIGALKFGAFERGKLTEMRFNDMVGVGDMGNGQKMPFKLGTFAIKGFDLVRVIRVASALGATATGGGQPSPDDIAALFTTIEGIEFGGIATPVPPVGQVLQIDRFDASWGQFVNNLPSKLHLVFKGTVPLTPGDPQMQMLRQMGIPKLAVDTDNSVNWIEADRLLDAKINLAVDHIGAVSLTQSIGNVPRAAFSIAPNQIQALASGFEVGPFSLEVRDQGFVQILNKLMTQMAPPPTDPSAPRPDPLAAARQMWINPAQPSGNATAILDAASNFLAKPGQKLSLKLVPKAPLSFADLDAPEFSQMPGGQAALLERFTVDVAVTQ